MKNCPQGVMVVPMAAMTVSSQTVVGVTCGVTALCAASPHWGWARMPATT